MKFKTTVSLDTELGGKMTGEESYPVIFPPITITILI